jgi:acyl carrier protein
MPEATPRQKVVEFLGTLSPATRDGLDHDADLMEAGVDSVAMMDVIVWLEDTFGISIDPDDLTPENFGSVNRIVAYLER